MRHTRANRVGVTSAAPDALGPTPVSRAIFGVLLGVGAGILASRLLPRPSVPPVDNTVERAV